MESACVDLATSSRRKPLNQLLMLLVLILVIVFLGPLIADMLCLLYETVGVSTFYRQTTGTIVAAKVEPVYGEDSVGYVPDVLFRYAVGSETFEGSRYYLTFGRQKPGSLNSENGCRTLVEGLHPGSLVTVYYDPLWPSHSVLSREVTPHWVMLAAFLLPVAIFVVMAVHAGRKAGQSVGL